LYFPQPHKMTTNGEEPRCDIDQQYAEREENWKPFDPISCRAAQDLFYEFTQCSLCPEIGRCKMLKRLGSGTFGSTWLLSCLDTEPEDRRNQYVLKLVSATSRDFSSDTEKEIEAQILMSNIAPLTFQVCRNTTATKYIIRMEKMDETLYESHFSSSTNQDQESREGRILEFCVEFFTEMQRLNYTHCDFSPNNIMLKYKTPVSTLRDKDTRAKLIDWGRSIERYLPLFTLISATYYTPQWQMCGLSIQSLAHHLHTQGLLNDNDYQSFSQLMNDDNKQDFQDLLVFQECLEEINMENLELSQDLTIDSLDFQGSQCVSLVESFEKNTAVKDFINEINTTFTQKKKTFLTEIWTAIAKLLVANDELTPRQKLLSNKFLKQNDWFLTVYKNSYYYSSTMINSEVFSFKEKFFFLALIDLTNNFKSDHSIRFNQICKFPPKPPSEPLVELTSTTVSEPFTTPPPDRRNKRQRTS
jgi:hypothetical protein